MARNKYPEETVKLILDQALELLVAKGYDDTTIQDIISRLGGLSKGDCRTDHYSIEYKNIEYKNGLPCIIFNEFCIESVT